MTDPVEGCPQGSEPWRERAWTPEQEARQYASEQCPTQPITHYADRRGD
jgi:hypothetical protein